MPIEDESLSFETFSSSGVGLGDTFEIFRQKVNGTIVEVSANSEDISDLRGALYTGGSTPNFVTLTTDQTITGVKTFLVGSSVAPVIKFGSVCGLWYDSAGAWLNVNQAGLKAMKLAATGGGLSLNGVNYTTPVFIPAGTGPRMMTAITSGQMTWSTMSSLLSDSTLGVDANGLLKVGTVQSANIAANAIDASKIADGTVGTAELANLSVTSGKIANNAVGTTQLANSSVGTTQMADTSVTSGKIANNAVGTTQIADSAITPAKLSFAGSGTFPFQVIQVVKSDTQTINSGSWQTINNLIGILNRSTASSKVRIQAMISGAGSDGTANQLGFRLVRVQSGYSDVVVGVPAAAGNRFLVTGGPLSSDGLSDNNFASWPLDFVDSPPAGALISYKVEAFIASSSGVINKSRTDTDNTSHARGISTLTLTELI